MSFTVHTSLSRLSLELAPRLASCAGGRTRARGDRARGDRDAAKEARCSGHLDVQGLTKEARRRARTSTGARRRAAPRYRNRLS